MGTSLLSVAREVYVHPGKTWAGAVKQEGGDGFMWQLRVAHWAVGNISVHHNLEVRYGGLILSICYFNM